MSRFTVIDLDFVMADGSPIILTEDLTSLITQEHADEHARAKTQEEYYLARGCHR